MSIVLKCDRCGEEFERYPSQINERNFCSKECKDEWQSEKITGENNPNWSGDRIEKNCPECGEVFTVPPYHSERIFCSTDCQYDYLRKVQVGENAPNWQGGEVKLECEWCGETYYKKKSHVDDSRFCSAKCQNEWMSNELRGKNHPLFIENKRKYYGTNWEEQRKKALERDNYTCQVCDSKQNLNVHHKEPLRIFDRGEIEEKANRLDNLITLCASCHIKIENRG